MRIKSQAGQGILLALMCIGVLMASFVIFGAKREEDVGTLIQKFDTSQAAFEALSSAAKRVQYMYSVESGCDPATLETRLTKMAALPDLGAVGGADDLGVQVNGRASYVIAVPGGTGAAVRQNRCQSVEGCRQFAIPVDNQFFVVTAGKVIRDAPAAGRTTDCPRDLAVRLSTVVAGNAYFQTFSLTNICTYASCTCTDVSSCPAYDKAFMQTISTSSLMTSTSCTNNPPTVTIPARKYGSIVNATDGTITQNDLRWARRYIETGGGAAGETNFMVYTGTIPSGENGSCAVATSGGQCKNSGCVPPFDLNRDGTNNDIDLAILENWMRGYVTSLPVNELN